LKYAAEAISRQIRGWTAALQNTPIRGQRYLNENMRAEFVNEKSRRAFFETLKKCSRPVGSKPATGL
jgi:hypothetical protein